MIDTIVPLLKFCSWVLVISFINGIRYIFLKRKLKLIYEEHKKEIHKAIRCNKIKLPVFFIEPLETGNDMLDLLLFKIHRSVLWFIGLLFFYPVSVVVIYLLLQL
jgi:hypothetical protein